MGEGWVNIRPWWRNPNIPHWKGLPEPEERFSKEPEVPESSKEEVGQLCYYRTLSVNLFGNDDTSLSRQIAMFGATQNEL